MWRYGQMRKMRRPGALVKPRSSQFIVAFLSAVYAFSTMMLVMNHVRTVREDGVLIELAAEAKAGSPPHFFHAATPMPTASPSPGPVAIWAQYRKLHEQNGDMAGWIKIDGTGIDYPVMYTPDDGAFYLTHGFDKAESKSGVPFIDRRCTVDPFGTNTIVYGHHMKNGTMFSGLLAYEDEYFYMDHSRIRFDTLYEQREYRIIAVFRSQIYKKSDDVFKHYNFINAGNETDFTAYIAHIKEIALYDTGVTAEYGDELLTLVTCSYHTENGQFVVVAKKVRRME